MFRVLIAEDERIERLYLGELLEHSLLEIDEIILAENGKRAIELCELKKPDIILMDIEMPVMNGLDAIKIIKQDMKLPCAILILTSYDSFSYAQEGIRMGVDDFLLKPCKEEQILSSVAKAMDALKVEKNETYQTSALIEKMKQLQPVLQNECMQAILSKRTDIEIVRAFAHLQISVHSGVCLVFEQTHFSKTQLKAITEAFADRGYYCLQGYRSAQFIIFLFNSDHFSHYDEDNIKEVLQQFMLFDYPIGIGSEQEEPGKFYTSYKHARQSVTKLDEVAFHLPLVQHEPSEVVFVATLWQKKIIEAFDKQEDGIVLQLIHQLHEQLLAYDVKQINTYIGELLVGLSQELQQNYAVFIDPKDLKIIEILEEEKYQSLEISLLYMMNALLEPIKQHRLQNNSYLVKQAIAYISKNFNKPVSLGDLASELQISPFYLSKLLNKECGNTFTDIINDYRIEEAKRLIRSSHRMKEVAIDVGFQSSSYFAKIFKKVVGITPTEYRELFIK